MAVRDKDYHFSVTLLIEELPVLYCLRALSMFSQKTGNVYKPWKKAGKKEWERNHIVSFHFTSPDYRSEFIRLSNELLADRWENVGDSDDNPLPEGDD